MASPIEVGEAFVLFLVALGYVPVIRAYRLEREFPWLVAGYTALLAGRIAAVAGSVAYPGVLEFVEYGIGIALTAACFAIHFYDEWRAEDSRYRHDALGRPLRGED